MAVPFYNLQYVDKGFVSLEDEQLIVITANDYYIVAEKKEKKLAFEIGVYTVICMPEHKTVLVLTKSFTIKMMGIGIFTTSDDYGTFTDYKRFSTPAYDTGRLELEELTKMYAIANKQRGSNTIEYSTTEATQILSSAVKFMDSPFITRVIDSFFDPVKTGAAAYYPNVQRFIKSLAATASFIIDTEVKGQFYLSNFGFTCPITPAQHASLDFFAPSPVSLKTLTLPIFLPYDEVDSNRNGIPYYRTPTLWPMLWSYNTAVQFPTGSQGLFFSMAEYIEILKDIFLPPSERVYTNFTTSYLPTPDSTDIEIYLPMYEDTITFTPNVSNSNIYSSVDTVKTSNWELLPRENNLSITTITLLVYSFTGPDENGLITITEALLLADNSESIILTKDMSQTQVVPALNYLPELESLISWDQPASANYAHKNHMQRDIDGTLIHTAYEFDHSGNDTSGLSELPKIAAQFKLGANGIEETLQLPALRYFNEKSTSFTDVPESTFYGTRRTEWSNINYSFSPEGKPSYSINSGDDFISWSQKSFHPFTVYSQSYSINSDLLFDLNNPAFTTNAAVEAAGFPVWGADRHNGWVSPVMIHLDYFGGAVLVGHTGTAESLYEFEAFVPTEKRRYSLFSESPVSELANVFNPAYADVNWVSSIEWGPLINYITESMDEIAVYNKPTLSSLGNHSFRDLEYPGIDVTRIYAFNAWSNAGPAAKSPDYNAVITPSLYGTKAENTEWIHANASFDTKAMTYVSYLLDENFNKLGRFICRHPGEDQFSDPVTEPYKTALFTAAAIYVNMATTVKTLYDQYQNNNDPVINDPDPTGVQYADLLTGLKDAREELETQLLVEGFLIENDFLPLFYIAKFFVIDIEVINTVSYIILDSSVVSRPFEFADAA